MIGFHGFPEGTRVCGASPKLKLRRPAIAYLSPVLKTHPFAALSQEIHAVARVGEVKPVYRPRWVLLIPAVGMWAVIGVVVWLVMR